MAVAIAGTPAIVDGGGSYTAETGSNRLVVWTFGAVKSNENPPALTGVTFGAVAMTLGVTVISADQTYALASFWYIKEADIPGGSNAFTPSWSVTPNDTLYQGYAWTLTGVDQTTPVVDTDGAFGTASSSLTGSGLTVTADGIALAHATKNEDADNFNTPAGYTKASLGNYSFSGHGVTLRKLITGAGTESPNVTFTSANAALALISIQAVSAGGSILRQMLAHH